MDELTPRRKQILSFIRSFINGRGYAPSVREIASGCGLSSLAIVLHHLNILEKEGYLRRHREVSRSIELTENGLRRMTQVPLLGVIAAGQPIPVPTSDSWSNAPLEVLDVADELVKGKEDVFALRVKGKSMVDAFIDDGDIVLMQAAPAVDNGEMVAVWLKDEQEVTLKRIYYEARHIRLQPANCAMEPVYVDPDNIEVQGRVIAVLRPYLEKGEACE